MPKEAEKTDIKQIDCFICGDIIKERSVYIGTIPAPEKWKLKSRDLGNPLWTR